jgi:hypothetical protein
VHELGGFVGDVHSADRLGKAAQFADRRVDALDEIGDVGAEPDLYAVSHDVSPDRTVWEHGQQLVEILRGLLFGLMTQIFLY